MITVLRTSAVAFALAFASASVASDAPSLAKGNAHDGEAKAIACAACHGQGGNSTNPQWPILAGQHAAYIEQSLAAYKSGDRVDPLMSGQASILSEEDMANLAAYFAAQPHKAGVASEESVAIAEPLYRGGDADRGIAACLACHGPKGMGNAAAAWPAIAGQHPAYLAIALKAYRAGERNTSPTGQMMTAVAKELTDAEIEALAAYVTGLQ